MFQGPWPWVAVFSWLWASRVWLPCRGEDGLPAARTVRGEPRRAGVSLPRHHAMPKAGLPCGARRAVGPGPRAACSGPCEDAAGHGGAPGLPRGACLAVTVKPSPARMVCAP